MTKVWIVIDNSETDLGEPVRVFDNEPEASVMAQHLSDRGSYVVEEWNVYVKFDKDKFDQGYD